MPTSYLKMDKNLTRRLGCNNQEGCEKIGNVMMKARGKMGFTKEGMVNGLSNEWYSKSRKGK